MRRYGGPDNEGAAAVNESADQLIEGLKLIRLNTARINEPDDQSYPYKLNVNLSPPGLMQVTFVMLYGGSEELVVRSMSREAIDKFIEANNLRLHPRLRRMTITGPDNFQEVIRR
jgi:hypothetical protein